MMAILKIMMDAAQLVKLKQDLNVKMNFPKYQSAMRKTKSNIWGDKAVN